MNLEKFTIIDDLQHHLAHVIGHVGVVRDDLVKHRRRAVDRFMTGDCRCPFTVRQRQEGHQRARLHQHFNVVLERAMRHAGDAAMHLGAAKLLGCQILMRDGFDDIGPGDEHIARSLDHEDEVGNGR